MDYVLNIMQVEAGIEFSSTVMRLQRT